MCEISYVLQIISTWQHKRSVEYYDDVHVIIIMLVGGGGGGGDGGKNVHIIKSFMWHNSCEKINIKQQCLIEIFFCFALLSFIDVLYESYVSSLMSMHLFFSFTVSLR